MRSQRTGVNGNNLTYVSRLAANARCQASQLQMTAWMVGALLGHGGEAAMFVKFSPSFIIENIERGQPLKRLATPFECPGT